MQRQWWAFDRPILRDPLLWAGIATGMALVVLSPPTVAARWHVVLGELLGRLVVGIVLAGVFGGFVRNLLRALEQDSPPASDPDQRSSLVTSDDGEGR